MTSKQNQKEHKITPQGGKEKDYNWTTLTHYGYEKN